MVISAQEISSLLLLFDHLFNTLIDLFAVLKLKVLLPWRKGVAGMCFCSVIWSLSR
jgi:hypothetical protein